MHAEQVNQSIICLEIRTCVFMLHTYAFRAAPTVFCWANNKCQLIKIPTMSYCNLSSVYVPEIWHCAPWECSGLFSPLIDPADRVGRATQIPSATSVRLGWVKESSLWLLSLWITPQYGIMLQWMSADTILAVQLWATQQRFGCDGICWSGISCRGPSLLTVIHTFMSIFVNRGPSGNPPNEMQYLQDL